MKLLTTSLAALGLVLSLGALPATDAAAKGHNQGLTGSPGENVGSETVSNSQEEGSVQGQGNATGDTPAGENPGRSEDAGRGSAGAAGSGSGAGSQR